MFRKNTDNKYDEIHTRTCVVHKNQDMETRERVRKREKVCESRTNECKEENADKKP